MILKFYKTDISKEKLKQLTNTTSKGTSMYDLMKAATFLGFESYGQKGDVKLVKKEDLPFIAHFSLSLEPKLYHFVIVSRITDNKITILDPSTKEKTLSIEEFRKLSTSNYLFIKETPNTIKRIRKDYIITERKKVFRKNRYKIFTIISEIITLTSLEIISLFFLKLIINNSLISKSLINFKFLIVIFSIILLLKIGLTYFINLTVTNLNNHLSYHYKSLLMRKILSLPNLYYQTITNGNFINLFAEVDIITELFTTSSFLALESSIILIFIYLYLNSISSFLVLLLFFTIFLLLGFIYISNIFNKNIIKSYFVSKDNYQTSINSIVINEEKIKGLNLGKIIHKRFKEKTSSLLLNTSRLLKYKFSTQSIITIIDNAIYLIILTIVGYLLITTKKISLATFILVESLVHLSLSHTKSIIALYLKREEYQKLKLRLNDILELEEEPLLFHQTKNLNSLKKEINIKNLTFKYYNIPILKNINLVINAKDKVFIYGASGSGKSTLVKLLGRYLPVHYNSISINEIDITHYNLATLRKMVTYISSNTILTTDTIKDSIYLSRHPNINSEKILSSSGVQKLFKEKKYNLATKISESASNLSMGEVARINLAQGLLNDSEIYILDECLSNVDIKLEKEIIKNILSIYHDKIIIYISHRISNKNLFNRIFYMNNGKCYEKK